MIVLPLNMITIDSLVIRSQDVLSENPILNQLYLSLFMAWMLYGEHCLAVYMSFIHSINHPIKCYDLVWTFVQSHYPNYSCCIFQYPNALIALWHFSEIWDKLKCNLKSETYESMYADNTFGLCQPASQAGTDYCKALSVAAPYTGIAGELKDSADGKR